MSLIVAVNTFEGIVVAGDKRITLSILSRDDKKLVNHFSSTDHDEKVFLSKDHFSVQYCNDASINDIPVSKCVKNFLRKSSSFESPKELALALKKYLVSLGPTCKVSLLVSGYQKEKPSIYEIHTNDEIAKEWLDDKGFPCCICSGRSEVFSRFDEKYGLSFCFMRIADAIDFCDFLVKATSKLLSFSAQPCTVSPTCDIAVITPYGAWWVTPREPYE